MKIAIYQIAIERDENRLAFQSLNHIISVSNGRVPAELYDCVFAGEVSAQTLEDIFYVFNMENGNGSVRAPTAPYTANVRTIMAAITITSRVVNLFFSVVVFIKKLLSKNRSVGFTRMS